MVPVDFSSGASWAFWIGILIGILGFGLAFAGYASDQQTRAAIARVQADANARVTAAQNEARARVAELEQKTGERRLNAAQRQAFENLFQPALGHGLHVSYMTGQGTGDVGTLTTDILAAARSAGATTEGNGMAFSVLPPGISFSVSSPKNQVMVERINRFGEALNVRVGFTSDVSLKPDDIRVLIGSRAPGFP